MKIAIITLLLLSMLLMPAWSYAQQWSNDPVTDSIKKGTAALIKYQGLLEYCKGDHSHDKECAGIYDNIPWTYMDFNEAVKLGQKQLDEQRVRTAQAPVQQRSLGELAREQKVLKTLREALPGICEKKPDITFCKSDYSVKEAFLNKFIASNPNLQGYIKTGSFPDKTDATIVKSG